MDLNLSSLALRFLTEAECKRFMRCHETPPHEVIEWETNEMTFHRCPRLHMILRTGAMGGDVRSIDGGWLYLTADHMDKEWREIGEVAKAFKRGEK